MRPTTNPWLVRFDPRPGADLRLFCFPHAGVGASVYRAWPAHLPGGVELLAIQPPGRESRLREPPVADVDALAGKVVAGLEALLDRPYAFFGHSMGALVAYECARILERSGAAPPTFLFVSGRRAPHLPRRESRISDLPEEEFVTEVRRRYGGIPDALLRERALLSLFLPALRADIGALEEHCHEPGDPLRCPVRAYGGDADPWAEAGELDAWRSSTLAGFGMRRFPGGHFYLEDRRSELIDDLMEALERGAEEITSGRVGDRYG